VPFGTGAVERDRIVREFQAALRDTGLVVPMATTNCSRTRLQGRRLHGERPAGARLRAAEDDARPSTSGSSSAPRST
jgi:hypothetical protein